MMTTLYEPCNERILIVILYLLMCLKARFVDLNYYQFDLQNKVFQIQKFSFRFLLKCPGSNKFRPTAFHA